MFGGSDALNGPARAVARRRSYRSWLSKFVLFLLWREFFQQLRIDFIRRGGGLTAVGSCHNRDVMLGHDYDLNEEPAPAPGPKVHHAPAIVSPNSPP